MRGIKLPPDVHPPPRWPPTAAMLAGVACLVLAVAASVRLGDARDTVAEHTTRMESAVDRGVPIDEQRAMLSEDRALRGDVALWERRRLGLILAGVVLLVGGFGASGLRALHDRMAWAVIDEDDD